MEQKPQFRKQHWLPAAYLRNFSVDGAQGSRKSMIWRITINGRTMVPVESQGVSPYHYSEISAERVEKEFKVGEDFYAECYPDFWKKDAPGSARKSFGLLLMMLDLHIRNRVYAKADRDNHPDYLQMSATVKYQILWGRKEKPPNDEAIAAEARRNWRVGFIRCAAGNNFLTSDNPSILVKLGEDSMLANVVLMPVTPFTVAVGYDSRKFILVPGAISERDETSLTQFQVGNCLECVYTRDNIDDQHWKGFKELLAKRKGPAPVEGPGLWGVNIFKLKKDDLGFLAPVR